MREVEIVWRKVNEKTHEKKVLKNISVLALLLTSTREPYIRREEMHLVGSSGYESEEIAEDPRKRHNKAKIAESPNAFASTQSIVALVDNVNSLKKKGTFTIISKPDPTSIVGTPSIVTTQASINFIRKIFSMGIVKALLQV